MTPIVLVPVIGLVFSAWAKFILDRSWPILWKFTVTVFGLALPPAALWMLALSSPGSGWGFGLVAIFVTASATFGGFMGWVWHSFRRSS